MKLFVDNLTNVDVSYLDPKRGLVGESWLAGLLLEGELNEESMICDFGIVKKNAKQWLDQYVDHTLVVPEKMDGLKIEEKDGFLTVSYPHPKGGQFNCYGPKEAFCIIDAEVVDPSTLSDWIAKRLTGSIPGNIAHMRVALNTELIGGAYYHYSHGLKKHDGNCQRIAHGHRSKIEVYIDRTRQPELEKAWSSKWKDIYVGTAEDLVKQAEIDGVQHNFYEYQAPQGRFTLSLPSACCYDVDSDTTVEQIANHIAQCFKQEHPDRAVSVKAYEGVAKGAIAEYE